MIAGDALGAMTFTGIFVGGLNRQTYFANAACRVETFFMTPELSKQDDRVLFLPLCYADILGHLRRTKIDAALFSVDRTSVVSGKSVSVRVDLSGRRINKNNNTPHISTVSAHLSEI